MTKINKYMRLDKKYKKFSKLNTSETLFSEKILNFKRSKWKNAQKNIRLSSKIGYKRRSNPFICKLPSREVENIQRSYKQGLDLKSSLILSFDKAIRSSSIKKELSYKLNKSTKDVLANCLIKPLFRIDILLWKLNFFKTSFQARQFINERKILINSKPFKSNYFVKKGDIITFRTGVKNNLFLDTVLESNINLYSFVEFDNLLKTIVIIKDLDEFSSEDISLVVKNFFDINKLKNYI